MSENREGTKKDDKGNGKTKPVLVVLVLAVILVVVIAAAIAFSGSSNDKSESAGADNVSSNISDTSDKSDSNGDSEGNAAISEDDAETEEETEEPLPVVKESDALTLSSVYTSSILNPDCGGEYAEDIASLEVTNSSDRYLVSASLTAIMSDGTEVQFLVSDLPAGATAEIFDTENQTLDADVTCTSLVCTSEEFIDEDVLLSDYLEVTTSGSDAVITNTGDSALTGLTVVYHCDMAGQYFGGASYTITIDNLAAGESYTLSDSTLMGEVAVVRIYQ